MIISMLKTIQHMQHHIRTSFGDPDQHYGGNKWVTPPHGTIQGNGASPMIWSGVSAILFQCLKRSQCGASFISPVTLTNHHTSGFAFVDDTDLVSSSPAGTQDDIPITPSMQRTLNNGF